MYAIVAQKTKRYPISFFCCFCLLCFSFVVDRPDVNYIGISANIAVKGANGAPEKYDLYLRYGRPPTPFTHDQSSVVTASESYVGHVLYRWEGGKEEKGIGVSNIFKLVFFFNPGMKPLSISRVLINVLLPAYSGYLHRETNKQKTRLPTSCSRSSRDLVVTRPRPGPYYLLLVAHDDFEELLITAIMDTPPDTRHASSFTIQRMGELAVRRR